MDLKLVWSFRLQNHEDKYFSLYTLKLKMRSGRKLRKIRSKNLEDEAFLNNIQKERDRDSKYYKYGYF